MSPAEYAFLLAQIFIARTLTPMAALLVGLFWLAFAVYQGW